MAEATLISTFVSFSATTALRELPVPNARCSHYSDGLFDK